MTKLLLDEMYPSATAAQLRERFGHDAMHVSEIGLHAAEDPAIAAAARAEGRALVTENVADFAAERDLILLFVLKKNLPAGGVQAPTLADLLDRWIADNPDPYIGHHWPE